MEDKDVDFGLWADIHQDTIKLNKDATFLIWIKEESGWLYVDDGYITKFYNHVHDFVNNIVLADMEHNPDKWNRVVEIYRNKYLGQGLIP